MQTDVATLEKSMEVPQKLKKRTTLCPAIALLGIYCNTTIAVGIYPKDTKVLIEGTYAPRCL